jgi:hypothetical protein
VNNDNTLKAAVTTPHKLKAHFWLLLISSVSALYQSQSQSQNYFRTGSSPPISSSWRQAPWDSRPVILFPNWTLAVIVLMKHPLWREDGSVVYNCCCSSPAQSFTGPSPSVLMTTYQCLRFETPPNWRARSTYLCSPGTGWPGLTPGTGFPFRRLLRLVVGIATGYVVDDRGVGVRVPVGSRIISSPSRPDRLLGAPNLPSNGYRGFFPRG